MRGTTRGAVLFLSGLIVGAGVMASVAAQGTMNTGLRLNHVGVSVPNFQETLDFYENVMGYHIAYRFPPPADGREATAFIQISRDTFIELAQARAGANASITHIGVGADNMATTVARLRQNGATNATDPRTSANSGSGLANVTDPAGIRTELNEQPPESLMSQAIARWK
jgi:catechol 2,3-dioxygenase-like lactoylglutathione lyase family enzyme